MKFVRITKAWMHFTEPVPQVAAGEEIIVTEAKLERMRVVGTDASLGAYGIEVIDATI